MTQEDALRMLRDGPEGLKEWNQRRKDAEEIPDLSGVDLSGANLAGAMLGGAMLSNADLHGANLQEADLQNAVLIFANLADANLSDVKAGYANLIAADLTCATLDGADLSHAQLIKTHLGQSKCCRVSFHNADMSHADLTDADLTSANLSQALLADANLIGIILKSANLDQAAVMGVHYDRRRIACRGIRADSCFGHAVFKRDVLDQDWIETYAAQSRRNYLLYRFWSLTTDCGRSMRRVATAAFTLAMLFGLLYHIYPGLLNMSRSSKTSWTPFYYSIVTFTTLGFGDVTPGSLAGEILVTIEVMLGYLTLGILVSILANKVARRS